MKPKNKILNFIKTILTKKWLVVVFLFFVCKICNASSCITAGTTVTLTRQSEVDSFPINYSGCDVIEGSLTISGNDIVNLNGLIGVKTIIWDLVIQNNPNLVDLNGLRSLEYIRNNFIIIDNPVLTSLDGLNSLTSINGGFTIEHNIKLINLIGLNNLYSVFNFNISKNDLLVNLDGLNSLVSISNIWIENNLNLKNIHALNLITTLNGISINGNSSLLNLDGLNSIISVDGISITDNSSLLNLSGLNSLTGNLLSLNISRNASLINLTGLGKLKNIVVIYVNNNNSLLNLEGLNCLKTVSTFYLTYNTSLLNLNGLDSLRTVKNLFLIERNQSLINLKGLDNLYSSEVLAVQYNPSLTNLEGLKSFGEANFQFNISYNNSLTSLKGIGSMISGNLFVQYNSILTNVDGLDSLKRLNILSITNNPKLENINGLNPLVILTNLDLNSNPILNCCLVAKTIINNNPTVNTNIYGNDIGCSSVPEVLALTPTSTCCITSYTKDTITICQGQNIKVGTHTYTSSGIYNDTIKIGIGCDSIIITNLTVRPKSYQIINKNFCIGQSFTLSNGKIITQNGTYKDTIPNICDSIIEYKLNFLSNITTSVNANICLGKTYVLPKGNIISSAGIYKDTLRASFGCDSIVTTNLSITNPTPTQKSDSICEGKIYTLPSGKQVTNTGIYIDTIKQTNSCDSVVITSLSVFENTFSVSLRAIDTIDAGNSIEFNPMYSNQIAVNWNWLPNTNLSCSSCESPIASPTQNTLYSLTASSQNGCEDTATTNVIVRNTDIYIPSAFSPNNDGINDELTVFVTNPIYFHLEIYNRWSQLVFESNAIQHKWNGKYNGEEVPLDSYLYILNVTTANGKHYQKQGTINVLK